MRYNSAVQFLGYCRCFSNYFVVLYSDLHLFAMSEGGERISNPYDTLRDFLPVGQESVSGHSELGPSKIVRQGKEFKVMFRDHYLLIDDKGGVIRYGKNYVCFTQEQGQVALSQFLATFRPDPVQQEQPQVDAVDGIEERVHDTAEHLLEGAVRF